MSTQHLSGASVRLLTNMYLGLLTGSIDTTHQHAFHAVLLLTACPILVLRVDGEGRQGPVFPEVLLAHAHREISIQVALSISSLVPMTLRVPGEYTHTIEVLRLSVMGLVREHQVVRHLM